MSAEPLRELAWLTPEQAVAYLQLPSVAALYRLVKGSRLPYGRVGRKYRFDPRALDRWIEAKGLTLRDSWAGATFRTGTR